MAPDDFEVGYCKPPKHSQFKKGQSGNRNGRSKGAVSLQTLLFRAANQKVSVMINGRKIGIRKIEAVVTQLMNKAATGDHKATELFWKMTNSFGVAQDPTASKPSLESAKRDILRVLATRMGVSVDDDVLDIAEKEPT